ncbi:MAG: hypothetical protein WA103_04570, partial [Minisyncoccales bacterium]
MANHFFIKSLVFLGVVFLVAVFFNEQINAAFTTGTPVTSSFTTGTPTTSSFTTGTPVTSSFTTGTPVTSSFTTGTPTTYTSTYTLTPHQENPPLYVYTPPTCTSECSSVGQRRCSGNGYQTCYKAGNGCLYWGSVTWCGTSQTCVNGSCIASCTDECSINGQRVCSGNGWKQCGNYDSDSCLEWGNITQCGWNQTCVNGSCVDTCQNQCALNAHECSGSSGRTCVQSGQCTAWGTWQTCDSQCHSCGDGRCECGETKASCPQDCGYNTPTVNLDYYG